MKEKNLYEILNLDINASNEMIKLNFRKFALIYHPDKNNNSEESQFVFQIIYNAYKTLISEDRRKEYDNYLKTSSIIKKNTESRNLNNKITPEHLCSQFNYILWEIEDILNDTEKNKIESEKIIIELIFKIINFIDKWVLEQAGFPDYFYQARKILNRKSSDFYKAVFKNDNHRPYENVRNYF